jgi:hypothetical protein
MPILESEGTREYSTSYSTILRSRRPVNFCLRFGSYLRHALESLEIFEGLSVQRHNHRNHLVCSRVFWSGTILSPVLKASVTS